MASAAPFTPASPKPVLYVRTYCQPECGSRLLVCQSRSGLRCQITCLSPSKGKEARQRGGSEPSPPDPQGQPPRLPLARLCGLPGTPVWPGWGTAQGTVLRGRCWGLGRECDSHGKGVALGPSPLQASFPGREVGHLPLTGKQRRRAVAVETFAGKPPSSPTLPFFCRGTVFIPVPPFHASTPLSRTGWAIRSTRHPPNPLGPLSLPLPPSTL